LEPAWRVRVITPLLKSGGYVVKAPGVSDQRTGMVTVTVEGDFLGYEESFYDVSARPGGRMMVTLRSVMAHREGKAEPQGKPAQSLFEFPRPLRRIRILHLVRASESDHEAAVLGADRDTDLTNLTKAVQSDQKACQITGHVFCSWLPQGIAVIPERRAEGTWRPAR
jgi:hypothetical protein